VIGVDAKSIAELTPQAQQLATAGARLVTGGHGPGSLSEAELVIVSPGVPPFAELAAVERRGVPVISELELASRLVTAPIVLVGGTNGKSTVTALVGEMLAAATLKVFVGGNYGTPLVAAVDGPWEVLVVEISSFQAERIPTLRPKVCALLNISEDHLDRYPSFHAYADAKGNSFVNTTVEDVAVIPAADELCRRQAQRGKATIVTFSSNPQIGDIAPESSDIVDRRSGQRFSVKDMQLPGQHNLANACAAVACAVALGASAEAITTGLTQFKGLEHRTELVAEARGVRFFNDSKGTNVGATVAALLGLDEGRAVLIAGGRDKGGSYGPLVDALRQRGRALVVLGEAAERIAAAAEGIVPCSHAASVPEAVQMAAQLAQAGDAVLFSPACSSFDMFSNYRQRGEAFAQAVRTALEVSS